MEEKTTIACSGKIRFINPAHAIETQEKLLAHGFRFFVGKQEPRPNAYGVMWRNKEIRSAGNEHAFKAYGVPRVNDLMEVTKISAAPSKPKATPEQLRANAIKAGQIHREQVEDKILKLVSVVNKALKKIGAYEPNLYGTNSRSQARIVAWDKLYQECVRINKEIPQEGTLRAAIRRVLAEKNKPFMIPDSRRTTRAMRSA